MGMITKGMGVVLKKIGKKANIRAEREFAKGASKKFKNQVKFWTDLAVPSAAVIGTKAAVAMKIDKDRKNKEINKDKITKK